jgi:hypothetical protein
MLRIEYKPFGLGFPDFADIFVRRQATQCFESPPIVVGVDEIAKVSCKLDMAIIAMMTAQRRPSSPFDGHRLVAWLPVPHAERAAVASVLLNQTIGTG